MKLIWLSRKNCAKNNWNLFIQMKIRDRTIFLIDRQSRWKERIINNRFQLMTGDFPSKPCLHKVCITYKKSAAFAKGQGPDRSSGVRGSWWCKKDETDTAPKPWAHNREKGCGIAAKGGQSYCEIRPEFCKVGEEREREKENFRRNTLYARIRQEAQLEQPLRSLVKREPGISPRGLPLPTVSSLRPRSRPDCFVANYEERG